MLSELSPPPSSVVSVVQGILTACGEFRQVSFSHVLHQRNRPAHLLAKHAKGIEDYYTWIKEDHCFLEQVFLRDVTFNHS